MPLYTFIAEYDGGTYVSQVTALDSKSAVFAWAEDLDVNAIPNVGVKAKAKLIETLQQDEEDGVGHVLLDGLSNVWFFCVGLRGKFMHVNFVQTEQTP